ncbi:fam-a protein [Plasmodium yoelii]|uniref:Fam-a protein n=3 Tax=Plasmodium yoelii TaxID=5861 RepID=A0AAE9WIT7_PLAYO|nr:fam-a protein [Plasmodium yoelii]EAA19808.1 93 kDa protein [Plasmodium yoelii yoelii]WBY54592.1 fam-a protein [Plasmodium yoelii yoelii]CDU15990.1 fam-a protein [Plasmodium yoelii]VTZ71585.1 fam-a protein [Plasmodium yoelii]|eukprot:XP_022811288.1 fam-a protein [Plasmodium yoelii]
MNKFYIQIVFFLLSISVYVNNKILATEADPGEDTTSKLTLESAPESTPKYLTSEEIYEKNKHLLCTNPEETINAENVMKEAVTHLKSHAADMHTYKLCKTCIDYHMDFHKRKHEDHISGEKIEYMVRDSNKYNEVINELWDPDHPNFLNTGSVKIVRVYNPNLVMIQQRYKKKFGRRQKYFYALAAKVEVSEDTTIIVMTSANINDHNPSNKTYKNEIVKSANSFKTEVDSEDDIKQGKLKKAFVNLAGYIIQKYRAVSVTYIESIDGHASFKKPCIIGKCFKYYYLHK